MNTLQACRRGNIYGLRQGFQNQAGLSLKILNFCEEYKIEKWN